ncbi:MAG: hypothetical protein R3F42_02310 [Pseudomonadota bacterium]
MQMVTHHLNDDRQSGYFAIDCGYKICHWVWDAGTSTLRVRVGYAERPVELQHSDIDRLSEDQLLECLVELAKRTGEALGAKFGPKSPG